MGHNDQPRIVTCLRDMAAYLQLEGANPFKVRAFDVAAERLAGFSGDLEKLIAEGQLAELPGIGESIAAHVKELVTTGHSTALDELKAKYPPDILQLMAVPELGPKKAKTLYEALGVGSVDALEAACREGAVRTLKGFGKKSEEKLLHGVELYRRAHATGVRKTLGEVLPLAEDMLAWVKQAPGVQRASLGGSVRRGKETVGDADLIASATDAAKVFAHFVKFPGVAEVLGQGESKASVRLKELDLQVDLRVLPDADFATALHHFTGSKAHHLRLRGLAQEKGLKISEWGVHRGEQKLQVAEEAELYALLGMQSVPPELREDTGEVEAALAHTLPGDLVTVADIAGNVHAHTTWSDGRNSLLEMAQAAKALGLRYLTVTEHSRSSGYAGGLSVDQLKAQWDEIDQVNEQVKGFTCLKGIESDILADGSLDYDDAVLEQLDVVIGSIHQRYGQDEDAMTRRVLNAFDNPHLMVWGHPTGRLLNKREPVPLRLDEILDKAAEKGIVIEVNGCPDRLDFSSEHVRKALARGLKLVASTDAHSTGELQHHLPFAVGTARRGWARGSDVLNTLELKAFRRQIRRR